MSKASRYVKAKTCQKPSVVCFLSKPGIYQFEKNTLLYRIVPREVFIHKNIFDSDIRKLIRPSSMTNLKRCRKDALLFNIEDTCGSCPWLVPEYIQKISTKQKKQERIPCVSTGCLQFLVKSYQHVLSRQALQVFNNL